MIRLPLDEHRATFRVNRCSSAGRNPRSRKSADFFGQARFRFTVSSGRASAGRRRRVAMQRVNSGCDLFQADGACEPMGYRPNPSCTSFLKALVSAILTCDTDGVHIT